MVTENKVGSSPIDALETLFRAGTLGTRTDSQLLDRFLDGQDAAFETLVARHGPLVMRVCRGLLADPHDAQDAFQGTFLVLARRAGSIRSRDSLAGWLIGVATRVASRSRADAARRRRHERQHALMLATRADGGDPRHHRDMDLVPLVHEAVARLPAAYRAVVVLCDLESRSYEEAARALGCPLGTLKARLSRARSRLRVLLIRRGVVATTALAAVGLASREAGASAGAVAPALARATARAATAYAAGRSTAVTAGVVSARVAFLTEGVCLSMAMTQWKLVAAASLGLGLVLGGAVGGARLVAAPAPAPASGGEVGVDTRPGPDSVLAPERGLLTRDDVIRHAFELARSAPDMAKRAEALLSLGRAQARRGETAAAERTFHRAVQAAASIPPNRAEVSPHPIIRIASAQAESGDRNAALETFRKAVDVIEAEDERHQINNWINILPMQIDVLGRVMPETIAGYRRYLVGPRKLGPTDSRPSLLMLQAASGDMRGALRELEEGTEFAGPEGQGRRKAALKEIIRGVLSADDAGRDALERAKRAAADYDPHYLHSITRIESRLKRFADAVATARSIKTRGGPADDASLCRFEQAQAFAEVAMTQAKEGDKAGALATAREAIVVTDGIELDSYRTYPRFQAGDAMVEAGALDEARKVAESIPPSYRAELLVKIARSERAAGDEAAALEDLKRALRAGEEYLDWVKHQYTIDFKIKMNRDPGEMVEVARAEAARSLAVLQARVVDLPAAIRTVATIDAAHQDTAFLELARTQAEAGHIGSARDLIARIKAPERREEAWLAVACALPAPKKNNDVSPARIRR